MPETDLAQSQTRVPVLPITPMKVAFKFLLSFSLVCSAMQASQWRIETFAGNGTQGFSGDGGAATAAQIDNPFGVVRGPDGAIWFCEYTGQRIRRVAPDGKISTVAGSGKKRLLWGRWTSS